MGHLGQVLQWPRYENIRNTGEVLLVGLEETYNFIEKMIDSVCSVFRSKRLHLGMDEAIGIGEGRYKSLFRVRDAAQIFTDHVSKVNELCLRKGIFPLIWSDMIFACTGNNYSLDGYYQASAPEGIASRLPSNISLVYWDYFHSKIEDYSRKIKDHRDIGFEPWVAGGIWTWNRLITSLPFTFETSKALLNACKSLKVKNVFVTVW